MCFVIRSKMLSLWSWSHNVTFHILIIKVSTMVAVQSASGLFQTPLSSLVWLTVLHLTFFIVSLALASSIIRVRNVSFHSDGSTRIFGFSSGAKRCQCWACLYLCVAIFSGLVQSVQKQAHPPHAGTHHMHGPVQFLVPLFSVFSH